MKKMPIEIEIAGQQLIASEPTTREFVPGLSGTINRETGEFVLHNDFSEVLRTPLEVALGRPVPLLPSHSTVNANGYWKIEGLAPSLCFFAQILERNNCKMSGKEFSATTRRPAANYLSRHRRTRWSGWIAKHIEEKKVGREVFFVLHPYGMRAPNRKPFANH